jgi:hypothetical protein
MDDDGGNSEVFPQPFEGLVRWIFRPACLVGKRPRGQPIGALSYRFGDALALLGCNEFPLELLMERQDRQCGGGCGRVLVVRQGWIHRPPPRRRLPAQEGFDLLRHGGLVMTSKRVNDPGRGERMRKLVLRFSPAASVARMSACEIRGRSLRAPRRYLLLDPDFARASSGLRLLRSARIVARGLGWRFMPGSRELRRSIGLDPDFASAQSGLRLLFYATKRMGGGAQDFDAIKLLKFAAS